MTTNFRTNARIVLEIGRESIENKIIALSEIVKNSYDAYATHCHINMIDNGDSINLFENIINKIEVIDDGIGMDYDDLINKWLVIGTLNKYHEKDKIKNNSIAKRIPIGEKGIGRFAINKLGDKITLITKIR